MTEYKVIEEYPAYEVGDDGTVWAFSYLGSGKRGKVGWYDWRYTRSLPRYDDEGNKTYEDVLVERKIVPSVCLFKGKKFKNFDIKDLVAKAFIPNPENLPFVRHKDGDFTNNNVSNLYWSETQ